MNGPLQCCSDWIPDGAEVELVSIRNGVDNWLFEKSRAALAVLVAAGMQRWEAHCIAWNPPGRPIAMLPALHPGWSPGRPIVLVNRGVAGWPKVATK